MAELGHLGGKRAESARARRAEQLRRWRGSQTEQESAERQPHARREGPRVRFEDGAVFLAACSSGDTDEVKRLLARGADINTANVDGLTALHQVTPRGPCARAARAPGCPRRALPQARLPGSLLHEPSLRPNQGLHLEESRPRRRTVFGFPSTSLGCHGYWGFGPWTYPCGLAMCAVSGRSAGAPSPSVRGQCRLSHALLENLAFCLGGRETGSPGC